MDVSALKAANPSVPEPLVRPNTRRKEDKPRIECGTSMPRLERMPQDQEVRKGWLEDNLDRAGGEGSEPSLKQYLNLAGWKK